MIDRVVVTAWPGYFFMSVLCIRSIEKHFHNTPITILVDDFDLKLWPDFPEQYQIYLKSQFDKLDIDFQRYSQLTGVNDAGTGGWFRQQLIKLHVDNFVKEENILLVDADVILLEKPTWHAVPATPWPLGPVSKGFQNYIKFMLGIEPFLGTKEQNLCASWVPIRFVTRDLLQSLRDHIEHVHNKNFLQLHIELMQQQKIVAYDSNGLSMVMSEFEMLEVFRRHLWKFPLPFRKFVEEFYHTSKEDWINGKTWFEDQQVLIPDNLWNNLEIFGSNPAIKKHI